VFAIAPPMRISSTFGSSAWITSIFPEIFAPPSTATNGRLGGRAPHRGSAAPVHQKAGHGGAGRRRATASVEACARWAEPNASFT